MGRYIIMILAGLIASPSAVLAGEVVAKQAWVRLAPPVSDSTAAYMVMENDGDSDVILTAVESAAAKHVMMHGMAMKEGRMHMFELEHVRVPAHGTVSFEPGGMHIMLMGLNEALHTGQTLRFKFRTAAGESFTVPAVVRDMRH
ncbi:copper chaperone PCu(A)C [Mariprofundus ferrooxydans]|uniref:copper chaperone PCu(A)C n=1 Tax=Mariprofundus ferrooxydans TaxID=314344 RepID=UPI001430D9AB|nr:copper chaperone PCu(A)C [Mariprofundus ferrooxydans]